MRFKVANYSRLEIRLDTPHIYIRCRPVKVRRSDTVVLPLSHPTNIQNKRNLDILVCFLFGFLLVFNMRQLYCARYSYSLSVCLSVRLSATRWYCVETARSTYPQTVLQPGSGWVHMLRFVWPALNPLCPMHHLPRLSQGGQNVQKWRTFEFTGWITGKRLKI